MKKRITAALLTAILIISCFPSGVMTTISRADDAKKENILTKISEDAVLKYNTATGRYEGTAKLLVTGIQDEQCIVLNVNDIRDTNGCTLDVTFVDDEDKEEMTYKNGDIITLLYAASNYAYNVAYNIQLEKGTEYCINKQIDKVRNLRINELKEMGEIQPDIKPDNDNPKL